MSKVLLHHGVRFSRDLAGYAAGGLTQPTGTKWVTDTGKMPWRSSTQPTVTIGVTDAGIKPWQSLIKPTKNKTFSNKLGWDKRSVPNVLKEEFFLMISIQ